MLRLVIDSENYSNLRIKVFLIQTREVGFSVEDQPISAAQQWLLDQEEGLHSTIIVSPRVAEFTPTLVRVLPLQTYRDTTGRRAARDVEYVR